MIASDSPEGVGFPVVKLPTSAQASVETAVKFLVDELARSGRLPAEHAARVRRQVLHRESLGSTRISRGVALPHSKSDVVGEVLGIVGKADVPTPRPDTKKAEPLRLVCLLVTPIAEPGAALRALERLSSQLRDS